MVLYCYNNLEVIIIISQNRLPLVEAMINYHNSDITPFDVPGHKHGKGNQELDEFLKKYGAYLDVNSMKELDILSDPIGVIKEAEELMAQAYGSDHAFFMVNGTTSSVQAMILAVAKPGDKIILPRNAHKSAINGLILSGAIPVFIQPEIDEKIGIANGVTIESVEIALAQNPDAKAIFLINPTYYGVTSPLKEIIKLAHKHGVAVLADEAHGAHFAFSDILPDSAIKLGADMSSVSMHKTGGSLTQSSVLLLNEGLIEKNKVRSVINLTTSTSASYLLMASLDFARKQLALNGEEMLLRICNLCDKYREKFNTLPGIYSFGKEMIGLKGVNNFDTTKLSVNTNGLKINGYELYDILREKYKIQAELADLNNVLFIISLGDDEESLSILYDALVEISRMYVGTKEVMFKNALLNPQVIVSPRDAYYAHKKRIKLKESINQISGESVMVYPPGIPIITPGEKISEDVINYIEFLKTQHTVITGPEDINLEYIRVLGL
jgi:arginine/lysine/ornithine decarboxylase